MPGTYKLSLDNSNNDSDDDSEYTSEGGTTYVPTEYLNTGIYSRARILQGSNGKKKVVLDPVNGKKADFEEARKKYKFFTTLYPDKTTEIFEEDYSYRLVVPLVPGKSYRGLMFTPNKETQIKIFLSAVRALKDCHSKGFIVIDLKEDNIFYDASTDISYLIDGGLASKKNKQIGIEFQGANHQHVRKMRKKSPFYAPECFSVSRVKATEAMDIYSLGNMMEFILQDNVAPELVPLLKSCQIYNPVRRPTLNQIEVQLIIQLDILQKKLDNQPGKEKVRGISVASQNHQKNMNKIKHNQRIIQQVIENIDHFNVNYLSCKALTVTPTKVGVLSGKQEQLEHLNKIIKSSDLKNALGSLHITGLTSAISEALARKQNEINTAAMVILERLDLLAKIKFDDHLSVFYNKIQQMHIKEKSNPRYGEATQSLEKFFASLQQAKAQFLYGKVSMYKAQKTLRNQCQDAIMLARPILKEHREWKGAITKFIIDVISFLTWGLSDSKLGIFAMTESTQNLDEFQQLTENLPARHKTFAANT